MPPVDLDDVKSRKNMSAAKLASQTGLSLRTNGLSHSPKRRKTASGSILIVSGQAGTHCTAQRLPTDF
jgi:hypothetical protein